MLSEKQLDRLSRLAGRAVGKELNRGRTEACVVQVIVQEIDPVTRVVEQAHRMELSFLPPSPPRGEQH